ncbi:MAG: hypothetical protein E6G19_02460 [Actinobacteria bacterium]|nr:MAG: hypothetical protein E6G19_02460 [Actinomycetota bacterium]
MAAFETPTDFKFNRGLIADPEAFARDANAASWLFLCGEEFAEMEGGMSYASVQAAVPESANVVSDPPRVLNADLARQQVAALDQLPRPTLVTCRTGPRSSTSTPASARALRQVKCWREPKPTTRRSPNPTSSRRGSPKVSASS